MVSPAFLYSLVDLGFFCKYIQEQYQSNYNFYAISYKIWYWEKFYMKNTGFYN